MLNQQVLQDGVTWKHCTKQLPAETKSGKTAVVDGKVYYGGVAAPDDDAQYIVYCYDPPQDNWTTLPPLPVRWFGLSMAS